LLINLFFYSFTNAQFNSSEKKFHNKIDEATTSTEIEALLKSLNPQFSTFHINNSLNFSDNACKHISDSLHCTPWFKADFDNNGYTDLVVVGGWDDHAIFCILDSGDNRYAVNRLTRKIFQNCTFPLLKKTSDNNLLLYYSLNEVNRGSIKVDTLIYKFGDFVDYHSSWKNNNIGKIEFATHECTMLLNTTNKQENLKVQLMKIILRN
jgi:hypothetical protein